MKSRKGKFLEILRQERIAKGIEPDPSKIYPNCTIAYVSKLEQSKKCPYIQKELNRKHRRWLRSRMKGILEAEK